MICVELVASGVGEEELYCCWLGDGCKHVGVVFARDLGETSRYPARFVDRIVRFGELDLPDEFGGDNVVVDGAGDNSEYIILEV